MEFKKLEQNKKNKVIICFIFIVLLLITILLMVSKAKYQVTQSVQIVNGTINYKPYDFKIVGIFKENDRGEYKEADEVPTEEGYIIDEEQSKCMINENDQDTEAVLKTINGNHTFGNLKKMDKCTLYFKKVHLLKDDILARELSQTGCPAQVNGVATVTGVESTNKLICETEDDYGTSRYFRGKTDDNWVKFGQTTDNKDIWWRIIRINGNGTIRLIYSGKTASGVNTAPRQGLGSLIETTYSESTVTQQYNKTENDNKYVGFMYGGAKDSGTSGSYNDAHTNTSSSTIKEELETWWGKTNLENLMAKIDVDTGFCNDRRFAIIEHGSRYPVRQESDGGYKNISTAYIKADIAWKSGSENYNTETQTPTLKCGDNTSRKRDLFTGPSASSIIASDGTEITGNNALTKPVGLITIDEGVFAGGFVGQSNISYWLSTSSDYWTMSPAYFGGNGAYVFFVRGDGCLDPFFVYDPSGVRPVIILSADTEFTTTGTGDIGSSTNPYIVK